MKKTELNFALTQSHWEMLVENLFPKNVSLDIEHGVICIIRLSVGRKRRTLILNDLVLQHSGDIVWDAKRGLLLFTASYQSRAVDIANRNKCGVLFLHTHPFAMGKH